MKQGGSLIPRKASFVYYLGFAGLDHGCFRMEMYKQRWPAHPYRGFVRVLFTPCRILPRLIPCGDVVYCTRLAGLDHDWFRLEMYKKGARPSLDRLRSCIIVASLDPTTADSIWKCINEKARPSPERLLRSCTI